MPKLTEITTIINTALEANVFNTSRFQGAKYNAVAELVKEKQGDTIISRPCTVDDDGECTGVSVDDTYPMQLYHRVIGLSYNETAIDNFGEPVTVIKETATMALVFISDRSRVEKRTDELMAAVAVNLPATLTNAELATLDLYDCQIRATGQCVIDAEVVYNREYNLPEYYLKPNSVMCSLNYTIETIYSRKCFGLC